MDAYIIYLSKRVPIALAITLLSLLYIIYTVLYVPVPVSERDLLLNIVKEYQEILSNISNPFNTYINLIDSGLKLSVQLVVPFYGAILYVLTLTINSWIISLEAEVNNIDVRSAIVSAIHPVSFIELLSYSILVVEGNSFFYEVMHRFIHKKSSKSLHYSLITILIAIGVLSADIAIYVVLLVFS